MKDRGAWWATVHVVAKSWIWLSYWTTKRTYIPWIIDLTWLSHNSLEQIWRTIPPSELFEAFSFDHCWNYISSHLSPLPKLLSFSPSTHGDSKSISQQILWMPISSSDILPMALNLQHSLTLVFCGVLNQIFMCDHPWWLIDKVGTHK